MPLWQWLLDGLALVVALVLLYGVALVVRRRLISRGGGTFELSVRVRTERPDRGWLLGLGRYRGERLEWFRIFSLSPRPKRVWQRPDLEYLRRRVPHGTEAVSLYADHVIADVRAHGDQVEVAMSPASLTGFQAWLEAAPPGTTEHV